VRGYRGMFFIPCKIPFLNSRFRFYNARFYFIMRGTSRRLSDKSSTRIARHAPRVQSAAPGAFSHTLLDKGKSPPKQKNDTRKTFQTRVFLILLSDV